jgi:membrane-associated phospholipid phosphatase
MLKTIHDTLLYCDHVCWYYINTQWHNAFLDTIVPFFRNPWFWAPLYLFLAIFMPVKFGRNGLIWCTLFIISFILSDQVSATLLKPFFHRLRPCHNPYLSSIIHQVVSCGGQYGFPSSHAANHFSISIFSAVTLGRHVKWVWPVAISWAILVSLSQVYVGVHYPLDVAVGGLLGTIIGAATGSFFNYYFNFLSKPTAVGM